MIRRPTPPRSLLCGALLLLAAAWPAWAAMNTVAGLFGAGSYDEARDALEAGSEGARPGEDLLWRSRLDTDPAAALSLLESALADKGLPAEVRFRAALEAADIQAGRGRPAEVLKILAPFLSGDPVGLPGAFHLRAGLALRAGGRLQQAREMLASVRPDDPAFVAARYFLGDIALEQDDPTLAARYFDAAAKAAGADGAERVAAGRWRAYRAAGDDRAAAAVFDELAERDPGALALLEIRRSRQDAEDERRARQSVAGTADDGTDPVATRPVDRTGRYSLQFGAFSDRGLALEFQRRYQGQLPDLRIDKVRDDRGQFLYKVRSGYFVNPAQARTEAAELERRLNMDVIVSELAAQAAGN